MAKKSVSIPAIGPPPTPAAVDALCSLLSSYLDLNVPPPQALLDLLPEDAFAAGSAKSAPAPHWLVPTCFSPLYSAGTPLASMRKLGPVAWQAVAQGLAAIHRPEPVDPACLRRLHTPEYVAAFLSGLEPLASSAGWRWQPQIRDGVLAINGGQLLGARLALRHGIAANVAQGFHHALPETGGGFCTFNGLALVAQEFPELKVMVLDCDEHGGNGTEVFTDQLPNLFNYSIHGSSCGMYGYERSIRCPLDPVTLDFTPYRQALADAFARADRWRPDLLLYQAGADPHLDDPLGSLGMTTEQLFERDRLVFAACRARKLPVLFVLAGGYQEPIETELVPLHLNTFRAAQACFGAAAPATAGI